MSQDFRIEEDAIGKIKVPKNALYGSFTTRARENFQLSGQKTHPTFIKAVGLIKQAAAETNAELKELEPKLARAIEQAAKEFAQGKFSNESQLDPFQAGAGTPFNMNANEIIANRANQILKQPLGSYKPVHPNNHVNMSQSSNDFIPTAVRLATLLQTKNLTNALSKLINSFDQKAKKHPKQIKVGRTHLQDAVPMTVGQEFGAWRDLLKRDLDLITNSQKYLLELGIGGTAIGSGINTHRDYQKTILKNLAKLTGLKFSAAKNTFESNQSMTPFTNFSACLRSLATDLIKICNDLKILNMGPQAGIAEYILPEVEPGSSIMPGKVNPSIPEALEMICYQVTGNEHVITLAAQRGQLQLNIMAPLIMFNLLWSIDLLTNAIDMFRRFAIEKIIVDTKKCQELFDQSLTVATALAPYLGYQKTALIVNEALQKRKTIKQIVIEKKLLDPKDLAAILDPIRMTTPGKLLSIKAK